MAMRMNYANIRRKGQIFEQAEHLVAKKEWKPNQAAKAAGPAKSLSPEMIAEYAAMRGFGVSPKGR